MDYSDDSKDGENYHIWDIFGNGLDMTERFLLVIPQDFWPE